MSERDPLGGVTIGAREIYDELVGMRGDVRDLTHASEMVSRKLEDHEERLRTLERWKYALPTAAVSGLLAAGVTLARAAGAL
jgi:hypothetical protein